MDFDKSPTGSLTLVRSYPRPVLPLSGLTLVRFYPCPVLPLPGLTLVRPYPCPVLPFARSYLCPVLPLSGFTFVRSQFRKAPQTTPMEFPLCKPPPPNYTTGFPPMQRHITTPLDFPREAPNLHHWISPNPRPPKLHHWNSPYARPPKTIPLDVLQGDPKVR